MSFLSSLTKKPKLDAATKKANKARTEVGGVAEKYLKEAYQEFADVLTGDPLRAAALYQWGVALLHQAKGMQAPESVNVYRNAISKFSFCMLIDPNYLAAAMDAGVACMDLARARSVPPGDELYDMAKRQFVKANGIQAGVGSFNLACFYAVRGDSDNCMASLKNAQEKGTLPEDADILADPDLASMKNKGWFKEFMASLEEERKLAAEKKIADKKAAEEAKKKAKPRTMDTYDPYKDLSKTKDKKAEETDSEPETKADETDVAAEKQEAKEKPKAETKKTKKKSGK